MFSLVIGASGSGKSAFAEEIILHSSAKNRYYLATMRPYDEESRQKIVRHQTTRQEKNFSTIECYQDLHHIVLPPSSAVLVECLSNLLANCQYDEAFNDVDIVALLVEQLLKLAAQAEDLVIVSNEVFVDGVTYDESSRQYLANLVCLNRALAAAAHQVIEVVYTLPIYHKKAVQ